MKKLYFCLVTFTLLFVLTNCSDTKNKDKKGTSTALDTAKTIVYKAVLTSINQETSGFSSKGYADFVIKNDTLTLTIKMVGTSPNIKHWQFIHGFGTGEIADCIAADSDQNKDGIWDAVEVEKKSGKALIPLNYTPSQLLLEDDSYPISDRNGAYVYKTKIAMQELEREYVSKYDGESIDLEKKVLYIYGISSYIDLPNTVQSVGNIPVHTLLPIACGKITKEG